MAVEQIQADYSESHHALLFGFIAKEIFERVEKGTGESTLQAAVRRYGEQRGQRMALRAQANGDELSMTYFLLYGE